MNNENIGVNYPCYGEYKCHRCKKTWASLKTWRNFGQKCKTCDDSIKPNGDSLLPLYYYVCETCEKVWKNKCVDNGESCKTCNNLVTPISHNEFIRARIGQPTLFKNSEEYVLKNGHGEDLCEKCQKYGPPCSRTYATASNRNVASCPSSSVDKNSYRRAVSRVEASSVSVQRTCASGRVVKQANNTCTIM